MGENIEELIEWAQRSIGLGPVVQGKLVTSIPAIVVLWLLRWLFLEASLRRPEGLRAHYRLQKTTTYVAAILGVLLVGRVWFEGVQSVATFPGLLSAGLAIALRNFVKNLAGWILILSRRPFEGGDRIPIGDHAGDVIDRRIFQFTLMEIGN